MHSPQIITVRNDHILASEIISIGMADSEPNGSNPWHLSR